MVTANVYHHTGDMRFLSSLLALWATVVSVAYGYSLPGGYERVLFYHSYVAECLQSDNKPSTIGNGCASPGKVCNFNQFMEYIIADVSSPSFQELFFLEHSSIDS